MVSREHTCTSHIILSFDTFWGIRSQYISFFLLVTTISHTRSIDIWWIVLLFCLGYQWIWKEYIILIQHCTSSNLMKHRKSCIQLYIHLKSIVFKIIDAFLLAFQATYFWHFLAGRRSRKMVNSLSRCISQMEIFISRIFQNAFKYLTKSCRLIVLFFSSKACYNITKHFKWLEWVWESISWQKNLHLWVARRTKNSFKKIEIS